jgi:hypothetical protein
MNINHDDVRFTPAAVCDDHHLNRVCKCNQALKKGDSDGAIDPVIEGQSMADQSTGGNGSDGCRFEFHLGRRRADDAGANISAG